MVDKVFIRGIFCLQENLNLPKNLSFCKNSAPMQIVLEINHEQDLKILLPLLERLKIAYKQIPALKNDIANNSTPIGSSLSDKYAGKLSVNVGEAIQQHIAQSRDEWERNI